ncbi:uncharacterized protein METZ01_LOCUS468305, partial [marine metagenome]
PQRPFKPAPNSFSDQVSTYPESLQQIIGHGIFKLIDYQDQGYAELYLERLNTILELDNGVSYRLTEEVAKRLAIWMTFEDVMRVAQLKTRTGRLSRIRDELGVDKETPLRLTDYFKPGRDEFIGILPPYLSWIIPDWKKLERGKGLALHIPTGSAVGFGLLKTLASLKFLRRKSRQYGEEQENMAKWLNAIKEAVKIDYDLACRTAQLSILARGYGNVRRNGQEILTDLFMNWNNNLALDPDKISAE